MSQNQWEIQRVSTSQRIFKKVRTEMSQPVGIMLFGADLSFKESILEELKQGLPEAKLFSGAPSTHEMVELIHGYSISIFTLSAMESADHELRHECVKVMRRIGARTVVGIYAKAELPRKIPRRDLSDAVKQQRWHNERCISALRQQPPTPDGLDYLIVVSEKED